MLVDAATVTVGAGVRVGRIRVAVGGVVAVLLGATTFATLGFPVAAGAHAISANRKTTVQRRQENTMRPPGVIRELAEYSGTPQHAGRGQKGRAWLAIRRAREMTVGNEWYNHEGGTMSKLYDQITEELAAFITAQPLFFVGSAPLDPEGHVNLSPKGLDCLRILSPLRVAYLDLTGSGNETSAHVAENGRITWMFCAFSGPPNILRLYGQGHVVLPTMEAWSQLAPHFPAYPGARQIMVADIQRVQTSCGFAVPLMEYRGQRDTLLRWAETKGEAAIADYHQQKNMTSIDGLPTPMATAATVEPAL